MSNVAYGRLLTEIEKYYTSKFLAVNNTILRSSTSTKTKVLNAITAIHIRRYISQFIKTSKDIKTIEYTVLINPDSIPDSFHISELLKMFGVYKQGNTCVLIKRMYIYNRHEVLNKIRRATITGAPTNSISMYVPNSNPSLPPEILNLPEYTDGTNIDSKELNNGLLSIIVNSGGEIYINESTLSNNTIIVQTLVNCNIEFTYNDGYSGTNVLKFFNVTVRGTINKPPITIQNCIIKDYKPNLYRFYSSKVILDFDESYVPSIINIQDDFDPYESDMWNLTPSKILNIIFENDAIEEKYKMKLVLTSDYYSTEVSLSFVEINNQIELEVGMIDNTFKTTKTMTLNFNYKYTNNIIVNFAIKIDANANGLTLAKVWNTNTADQSIQRYNQLIFNKLDIEVKTIGGLFHIIKPLYIPYIAYLDHVINEFLINLEVVTTEKRFNEHMEITFTRLFHNVQQKYSSLYCKVAGGYISYKNINSKIIKQIKSVLGVDSYYSFIHNYEDVLTTEAKYPDEMNSLSGIQTNSDYINVGQVCNTNNLVNFSKLHYQSMLKTLNEASLRNNCYMYNQLFNIEEYQSLLTGYFGSELVYNNIYEFDNIPSCENYSDQYKKLFQQFDCIKKQDVNIQSDYIGAFKTSLSIISESLSLKYKISDNIVSNIDYLVETQGKRIIQQYPNNSNILYNICIVPEYSGEILQTMITNLLFTFNYILDINLDLNGRIIYKGSVYNRLNNAILFTRNLISTIMSVAWTAAKLLNTYILSVIGNTYNFANDYNVINSIESFNSIFSLLFECGDIMVIGDDDVRVSIYKLISFNGIVKNIMTNIDNIINSFVADTIYPNAIVTMIDLLNIVRMNINDQWYISSQLWSDVYCNLLETDSIYEQVSNGVHLIMISYNDNKEEIDKYVTDNGVNNNFSLLLRSVCLEYNDVSQFSWHRILTDKILKQNALHSVQLDIVLPRYFSSIYAAICKINNIVSLTHRTTLEYSINILRANTSYITDENVHLTQFNSIYNRNKNMVYSYSETLYDVHTFDYILNSLDDINTLSIKRIHYIEAYNIYMQRFVNESDLGYSQYNATAMENTFNRVLVEFPNIAGNCYKSKDSLLKFIQLGETGSDIYQTYKNTIISLLQNTISSNNKMHSILNSNIYSIVERFCNEPEISTIMYTNANVYIMDLYFDCVDSDIAYYYIIANELSNFILIRVLIESMLHILERYRMDILYQDMYKYISFLNVINTYSKSKELPHTINDLTNGGIYHIYCILFNDYFNAVSHSDMSNSDKKYINKVGKLLKFLFVNLHLSKYVDISSELEHTLLLKHTKICLELDLLYSMYIHNINILQSSLVSDMLYNIITPEIVDEFNRYFIRFKSTDGLSSFTIEYTGWIDNVPNTYKTSDFLSMAGIINSLIVDHINCKKLLCNIFNDNKASYQITLEEQIYNVDAKFNIEEFRTEVGVLQSHIISYYTLGDISEAVYSNAKTSSDMFILNYTNASNYMNALRTEIVDTEQFVDVNLQHFVGQRFINLSNAIEVIKLKISNFISINSVVRVLSNSTVNTKVSILNFDNINNGIRCEPEFNILFDLLRGVTTSYSPDAGNRPDLVSTYVNITNALSVYRTNYNQHIDNVLSALTLLKYEIDTLEDSWYFNHFNDIVDYDGNDANWFVDNMKKLDDIFILFDITVRFNLSLEVKTIYDSCSSKYSNLIKIFGNYLNGVDTVKQI
jgi:hypothetical protein